MGAQSIPLYLGFAVATSLVTCTSPKAPETDCGLPQRSISSVLQDHTDELLSTSGVVGAGISRCDEKQCIRVFVVRKTPQLLARIPECLEGFPVAIEETGPIIADDTAGGS